MIRVFVVEDQTLVRQGIRSLLALAKDVTVVGEATDGVEALERIPKLAPDVVLLDMKMPRVDGLAVLRTLKGTNNLPPTLILTTFDDTELVLDGIRAGARGYLLKDVTLEQLLDAIRTLAGGKTLFMPAITERILRGIDRVPTQPHCLDVPSSLTPRETEVLRLMAGGYSNREIATALHVAEGTVKNQVSSILSKLGVRDRTRAVLRALEIGCI
ncbi:MAG: response regulator transcription factor [Planctomycetes bacterium]|nr:response regulator transcription factor [Planctomycetota bacterium]